MKVAAIFAREIEERIVNILDSNKRPSIIQGIPRKTNQAGRITLYDFNIEDEALGTETAHPGPKTGSPTHATESRAQSTTQTYMDSPFATRAPRGHSGQRRVSPINGAGMPAQPTGTQRE